MHLSVGAVPVFLGTVEETIVVWQLEQLTLLHQLAAQVLQLVGFHQVVVLHRDEVPVFHGMAVETIVV
jgi:hypothetical protein